MPLCSHACLLLHYPSPSLPHSPAALSVHPSSRPQVLHFSATLAPNQDLAFALCITWTSLNLLLSNYFIKYDEMNMQWLTQVRTMV